MAFILNARPSYSWPVTFNFPKDGGNYETSTFDVEFKHLKQSQVKKMLKDPKGTDVSFCKAVIVGWKGVFSKPGVELTFSESALDQVLDETGLAKCIASAFLESLDGAKVKN